MPLSNPSQKINPKNLRTFAHHKIRLLLSSLTTSITTKLPAANHHFSPDPLQEHQQKQQNPGSHQPRIFLQK
jgi:hypothetical protein